MTRPVPSVRIIGPGRAGRSFAGALAAAGWVVADVLGRDDGAAVEAAATGVDLVLLATPDAAVAAVARAVRPEPTTVVAHVAGSLGLDVLAPHERRAAIHPLVALPNGELGAARLRPAGRSAPPLAGAGAGDGRDRPDPDAGGSGAWFAVAGDALAGEVVRALGGRAFTVADEDRAGYHAAACIASNHLVALLGQVERVAAGSGVPLEAYLDLVQATVDNVRALGPAAALTGPAARGDRATIERHRAALRALAPGGGELAAYDALVVLARRLVES